MVKNQCMRSNCPCIVRSRCRQLMDPPSQANCITVHFQKCVYSVDGSLFRGKNSVSSFSCCHVSCAHGLRPASFHRGNHVPALLKMKQSANWTQRVHILQINVLGRQAQHPLVEPLNYVCPPSLALCISTQSSEHNWVVDLYMEFKNRPQICTFR